MENKNIIYDKNEELKKFIEKFLLPLLGVSKGDYEIEKSEISNSFINDRKLFDKHPIFKESSNIIHIGYVEKKKYLYKVILNNDVIDEDLNLARYIIKYFSLVVNSNNLYNLKTIDKERIINKDNNNESIYFQKLYDYSIQKGICDWIINANTMQSFRIEKLINILEEWSMKTYEGKNVCFGLLINPNGKGKTKENYCNDFLGFLESEYAAVLTDGITSIIEVDGNCDFIEYHSITKDNEFFRYDYNDSIIPYRFTQIIEKNVKNDKIGIFLLQNGDIIISKDKEISFIKRNGKWLNFKYNTFENIIYTIIKEPKLVKNIFSTIIDVSLAHNGGIIAVVDEINMKKKLNKIISPIDNLSNNKSINELYKKGIIREKNKDKLHIDIILKNESSECIDKFVNQVIKMEKNSIFESKEKDLRKKLTKREYVKHLIGDKKFYEIDKKLKCELIGLDGACIIDKTGKVISFGAIIKNDAGSSGGGRGAAAKKLSEYGGFAIKISTDGYIEVYIDSKRVYSIK